MLLSRARIWLVLLLITSCAIVALSIDIASAQGFVPLEKSLENSPKLADAYGSEDLSGLMQKVFTGAISLGAILAVLRLAWAGFVYMSSDLWTSKENAKEIIKDTLLGLFLLLAIYLILYQINPDILKLKIDPRTPQTSCNGAICGGER